MFHPNPGNVCFPNMQMFSKNADIISSNTCNDEHLMVNRIFKNKIFIQD